MSQGDRWVGAIGIDPGTSDPTAIVALAGPWPELRVVRRASVRHPKGDPITKASPAVQRARILAHAGFIGLEVNLTAAELEVDRERFDGRPSRRTVALEWYEDQGPVRARVPGRYLVPLLLGVLISDTYSIHIPGPKLWRLQVASEVLRLYGNVKRGTWEPQQIAGWGELRNEHERAAACHALFACSDVVRWGGR